jgi:hypothetical protein
MPRPLNGRVGRSAGVAEHRVARHRFAIRLSHTTALTRASALFCVVALALAGAPTIALAQPSTASLADTRAAIDATAGRWFAVQRESGSLDLRIEMLTKTLAQAERRVEQLRELANARVVNLYETGTQALSGLLGGDPLEVGRRAELIGQANAAGQVTIDRFESSIADLTARRDALHAARNRQKRLLRDLAARRRALDSELAALQLRSARAAQRTRLATAIQRADLTATTASPTRPAVIEVAATPLPPPVAAIPVPVNTGALSAHHFDPFLVCTRARESGSDYAVVSRDGYYGAYQFSPTTWNVTASHLGRLDLVGVLPSAASPYDQDEMAWSLYQWQGNGPWGGRC